MLPPLSWRLRDSAPDPVRRLLLRRGCRVLRASFQRVEPVPVLLPERFRGGCAFGDREFDSLPERIL